MRHLRKNREHDGGVSSTGRALPAPAIGDLISRSGGLLRWSSSAVKSDSSQLFTHCIYRGDSRHSYSAHISGRLSLFSCYRGKPQGSNSRYSYRGLSIIAPLFPPP